MTRKCVGFSAAFALIFCLSASATTHLTGSIGNETLKPENNPFIIEADIFVPKGQKTIISEGCIFLFKPFTGLTVLGTLEVLGSVENRVIFSSVNDQLFNPASGQSAAPFDWNGISLEKGCEKVVFKNVNISYSVYGIKSKIEPVVIDNGIFSQNGQYHFTINEKVMQVLDNIPVYHYVKEMELAQRKDLESKAFAVKTAQQKKTLAIVENTGAAVLMAGGIALSVSGIVFINKRNYWQIYHDDSTFSDVEKQNMSNQKIDSYQIGAIAQFVSAAICIPVSLVLFCNAAKNKKKNAMPIVSFGADVRRGEVSISSLWKF